MEAYWRALNYLSVGHVYLLDNPILKEPLKREHIKPRLLSHWATSPGLNVLCVHPRYVILGICAATDGTVYLTTLYPYYGPTTTVVTNPGVRPRVFGSGIQGSYALAVFGGELDAAEPLPRRRELWPWISWPALAIALFGIHQSFA
jgi:hypothetical protein